MHGPLEEAHSENGDPDLGNGQGQRSAFERFDGNKPEAADDIDNEAAHVKDEEQPVLTHAYHGIGCQVVQESRGYARRKQSLGCNGHKVFLAVNQRQKTIALNKYEKNERQ